MGTISGPSCPFICAKLVIHDVTCGFRLVSFTAQNLISRGLPDFGSFCKPPRNVVTETFAEPSANWEVSSNRILTDRPSGSFINVKLVIHYYLMYGFPPVSSTCWHVVTTAPNFQTVLQTSENFCNRNIPFVFTTSTSNGGSAKRFWLFWLMTLLLTRSILWLLSEKFLWTSLTFLSSLC